jgi:hypothetical protein
MSPVSDELVRNLPARGSHAGRGARSPHASGLREAASLPGTLMCTGPAGGTTHPGSGELARGLAAHGLRAGGGARFSAPRACVHRTPRSPGSGKLALDLAARGSSRRVSTSGKRRACTGSGCARDQCPAAAPPGSDELARDLAARGSRAGGGARCSAPRACVHRTPRSPGCCPRRPCCARVQPAAAHPGSGELARGLAARGLRAGGGARCSAPGAAYRIPRSPGMVPGRDLACAPVHRRQHIRAASSLLGTSLRAACAQEGARVAARRWHAFTACPGLRE